MIFYFYYFFGISVITLPLPVAHKLVYLDFYKLDAPNRLL
jgi:hypothetical protein